MKTIRAANSSTRPMSPVIATTDPWTMCTSVAQLGGDAVDLLAQPCLAVRDAVFDRPEYVTADIGGIQVYGVVVRQRVDEGAGQVVALGARREECHVEQAAGFVEV